MGQTAKLISLATAVPPHVLMQDEVAAAAREMFGKRYATFDRMAPVFLTAGIKKRHAARPIEWYSQPHGWKERTAAYLEVAHELFVDAATKALDGAGLMAAEVDIVVTVSSTGIATPSLEARALGAMGFRTDVQRVPVFGLGCAGGVSGFAIAARLAKAQPGANVLLVVVELCSLAFRLDQLTKANIVACALFGDGAAACILRAGEAGRLDIEDVDLESGDPFRASLARDAIGRALSCLSKELRMVVVLRYWGELSLAEIADRLKIPVGTVKSRHHAALQAMRRRIDPVERGI